MARQRADDNCDNDDEVDETVGGVVADGGDEDRAVFVLACLCVVVRARWQRGLGAKTWWLNEIWDCEPYSEYTSKVVNGRRKAQVRQFTQADRLDEWRLS